MILEEYRDMTVFHAGIAGIGIASGLSYIAAFLPVSRFFLKKDRIFRFNIRKIRWKTLIQITIQGAPVFMSFACYFLRVYCFIQMFLSLGGTDAVAVYSIVSVPGDILYRVGQGSGDVALTMASLLYEEEDRRSLAELVRVMVRCSLFMICGAVLLTCAAAPWIITLYLGRDSRAFEGAVTALRLFSVSFILSCIVCVFEHYFQGIRCLKMTNLLVVCDGFALTASMGWLFGKLLGLNGIWYGIIAGQAATLLVISLFVWKKARKVTLSAEAYSYLGSGFGADPGDILDFTVTDRQGAAAASENMRIFYLEKGVYAREAMLVSLCTEEIAMNILAHGFTADRRKHTLEIRTVYKGNCLTLHFRDNCVLFDPTEYATLHRSDGPDHIGLRMVMRMVDEAVYVNSLGLNNLFFTVHIG